MAANEERPLAVKPHLKYAPKIRQMYWCDFPKDAHLPEFWKRRPVIVVSYRHTLSGALTIIPCSTLDQTGNPWAVKLVTSVTPNTVSWAVCDKPTTVAVSRLLLPARTGIPRVPEDEFNVILARLLAWLPVLAP